jgi:hypothetical protein
VQHSGDQLAQNECLGLTVTCGNLMNALIPEPADLELMPDAAKTSEALVAKLDSTSTLEAIQVRASTVTPFMEEILQFRPSSHWGINE